MQISEILYFAKDELERNHACVQGDGTEVRRSNIQAMPTAVLRLGELSLLGFARHFPKVTEKLLGNDVANAGLRYVGGGSENTTVTDGKVVTKIFRKSIRWTEELRQSKAEQITQDHESLREYLGGFAVPQIVSVGYNPIRRDERAVLTSQDYYYFEDTGIFNPYGPGIYEQKVEELEARFPGISNSLGQFAEAGLRLYNDRALLVDTSGLNNVVIANRDGEPRLTCLDGTPALVDKQSVVDRLVGQMFALRANPQPSVNTLSPICLTSAGS